MVKQLVLCSVAIAALSACGGGKQASTTPDPEMEDRDQGPINDSDSAAMMVPPEKMDEIKRRFDRKGTIISRCFADAVERGDAPKNARGKMSLSVVISPSGRAETVKVVKSTFEAEGIKDCVIGHVQEIQFPTLPRPYPTSYTYAFEAM